MILLMYRDGRIEERSVAALRGIRGPDGSRPRLIIVKDAVDKDTFINSVSAVDPVHGLAIVSTKAYHALVAGDYYKVEIAYSGLMGFIAAHTDTDLSDYPEFLI